jgi:hypothetical protein
MLHVWGRVQVNRVNWRGNLRERDHLEDLSVNGKIILTCIFMKWNAGGGMNRMKLAQDGDRWRTVVNAVMNFRVQWNERKFLSSWEPISFSRRTLLRGVWIAAVYWEIHTITKIHSVGKVRSCWCYCRCHKLSSHEVSAIFRCLFIGLFWLQYVLPVFPCSIISVLRYDLFFCTVFVSVTYFVLVSYLF